MRQKSTNVNACPKNGISSTEPVFKALTIERFPKKTNRVNPEEMEKKNMRETRHMRALVTTTNFNDVCRAVTDLMAREKTVSIHKGDVYPVLNDYSESGLTSAGRKFEFPADYVKKIRTIHPDLANRIVDTSTKDAFEKCPEVITRSFGNGIDGVLSNRYAIFDDDEVIDILSDNEYLMSAGEFWYHLSPENFHIRFISNTPFKIPNDNSELHMAIFVDNSMLGAGSFKVRFGLYRSACTNGMIWGLKECTILRERHIGGKNIASELRECLIDVDKYERLLTEKIISMSNTDSKITGMTAEDAITYLKGVLLIGEKKAKNIIELYNNYGGKTKWDLCNAITDYAHQIDLNDRIRFETLALKVA